MFEYYRFKAFIYQLISGLCFAMFLYFLLAGGLISSQFKDTASLNKFILAVITDPVLLLALAFLTIRDLHKYIKQPAKTVSFDAPIYKKMLVAFSVILALVLLYNMLFVPHAFAIWFIAVTYCLFLLVNKLVAAYLFKCK